MTSDMPKVKVTKFNFSDQMLEKAKSDNPLVGALARMASEMIEDGKVPCQQTMWIDTDKVVAVGEVVKSKDDAGVPDVYTIYFSHGEKPEGWQITADSYNEFMQAWTGDVAATFDREPGGLVEQFNIRKALQHADVKDLLRDLSFRGFERVIDATGKEYNLMEYMEME